MMMTREIHKIELGSDKETSESMRMSQEEEAEVEVVLGTHS